MADQLKIRAEDVEPGDVVITFHGKRYTVKSFWMEDDYDDILDVERD